MSTVTPVSEVQAGVTDAVREQFLGEGFARLDGFIPHDELDALKVIYDRLFDETDADSPAWKQLGGQDKDGRATLPQILSPHELAPEMTEMAFWPRLAAAAAALFGEPATMGFSHAILKPAGYGAPTPWHQDQAYHDPARQHRNVNFWIPLDAVDEAGGCMQYVRRTHGGVVLPHTFLIPGDTKSAMVVEDQDYWSANATALPCKRGDVAIHHSYCMHYAGPNLTDVPRRALIVVYNAGWEELDRPWVFPWRAG